MDRGLAASDGSAAVLRVGRMARRKKAVPAAVRLQKKYGYGIWFSLGKNKYCA
jgi:hypothetical protein